ncbi:KxYKxGKxW signal peptide domain-containing protein [Lactiplantibacillus plantarum]|uniref:KxYKxGKxW signal peptide domain-containing protein n=1 Tax=Lactiplantibacillus plantarum TaxID=1590 RepID=UPI003CED312A
MEQVKKRYKMYKSGKVWLFAGITLVTLNMNVVTGRADESTHVEALTEPAVATLSEGNAEQQSPVTDAMDESAMSELVTEAQPIKVQAAEEQILMRLSINLMMSMRILIRSVYRSRIKLTVRPPFRQTNILQHLIRIRTNRQLMILNSQLVPTSSRKILTRIVLQKSCRRSIKRKPSMSGEAVIWLA